VVVVVHHEPGRGPDIPGGNPFAVVLLLIDGRASRLVARMFDRERSVTGAKAARP
jgi:hypothetical protein